MFDGLKKLWDSMTPAELKAKVDATNRITSFRSLCEARGYATCDVQNMKVTIHKHTSEVDELLSAFKDAGMSDIKIVDKTKCKKKTTTHEK